MTEKDKLDLYEERAGIREFCGGQDRATAEREAWRDVQELERREQKKPRSLFE